VTYRRLRLKLDYPNHPYNSNTHNRKTFGVTVKINGIEDSIQWVEGVHHPAVRNFMIANGLQVCCGSRAAAVDQISRFFQDDNELEAELMKNLAHWEADNGGWPLNPNPPPLRPPPELFNRFILNGSVIFSVDYRDESVPSAYVPYVH
jgi:hypothetical protein